MAEYVVLTVGEGRIRMESGPVELGAPRDGLDPLLTVAEVAARLGIQPTSWRSLVSQGFAPRADDPDAGRPANRRTPRWFASTVAEYQMKRASASWTRKPPE